MKLCECGCGKPTNCIKAGRNKGMPYRFVAGHSAKGSQHPHWRGGKSLNDQGYMFLKMPEHPRASHNGYVREHIVVAERALGHALPPQAIVHHVNEQRSVNRNNNLVICENETYHKLLHKRLRAYRATGSIHAVKCVHCGQWEIPSDEPSSIQVCGKTIYHRSCHAANQARLKREKRDSLQAV